MGNSFPSGSTVGGVARTPSNLDLFVLGGDGGVQSAYWDATAGWGDWFRIDAGADFPSGNTVTVVARTPSNLDLFVVGTDGGVYTTYWDASGWGEWFRIGAGAGDFPSGSTVTGVARTPSNLDLFVVANNGGVYSSYWQDGLLWSGWSRIGFRKFLVVHFKSLLPIASGIDAFINREYEALAQLFAEFEIRVFRGTTDDLSADASLAHLVDLDIEESFWGGPSDEQEELYLNRNNAAAEDLVIYVVRSLQGHGGDSVGSAKHPDGKPGAAIVPTGSVMGIGSPAWILAHEVGHVLGLDHVSDTPSTNSRFLMWPSIVWTELPPDLSTREVSTMLESELTRACSPDRSGW
jgi:hypothetical protein